MKPPKMEWVKISDIMQEHNLTREQVIDFALSHNECDFAACPDAIRWNPDPPRKLGWVKVSKSDQ